MTDEKKIPKIVFAPGCFDDFDGTQEELDELIKTVTEMAESGELFEKSVALEDLDDLDEEEYGFFAGLLEGQPPKKLH